MTAESRFRKMRKNHKQLTEIRLSEIDKRVSEIVQYAKNLDCTPGAYAILGMMETITVMLSYCKVEKFINRKKSTKSFLK